jgi:hypothetical protein
MVAPTNLVMMTTAAGGFYALTTDGTIATWGMSLEPPTAFSNVVSLSAGQFHVVAALGDGPPVQAAEVAGLQKAGDSLTLSLPTQSGRVYGLEYTGALGDTNWVALPLRPGNGASQIITDPSATNSTRFYRVRRW